MNIYEALSKIQNELKCPKSQYNPFGKYNYRNAEDILEAVKPVCAKYGAALTITDEMVLIGDRYYVRAIATLYPTGGKPEDFNTVSTSAFAREEADKKGIDGSQITGSASSYARKYALNGLFAIDDTKDADTTNNGQNRQEKAKTKVADKPAQQPAEEPASEPDDEDYEFPPESYKCAACGRVIPQKLFEQSLKKYRTPLCSAECLGVVKKAEELQ